MLNNWKCEKCKKLYTDKVTFGTEVVKCEVCGDNCTLDPVFTAKFKLVYNNKTDICDWDGNDTQYYDAIKKANPRKSFPVS